MKATKRSDPSEFAIPSLHNFLQSKCTFSSLQINKGKKKPQKFCITILYYYTRIQKKKKMILQKVKTEITTANQNDEI
jgi:hypothetical protein